MEYSPQNSRGYTEYFTVYGVGRIVSEHTFILASLKCDSVCTLILHIASTAEHEERVFYICLAKAVLTKHLH